MSCHTLLSRRSPRVAALLVAASLVSPLFAPQAHAIIGGCRGDPVVTLSNGTVVDLTTTVDDTLSDVRQIAYTLHVPPGVFAVAVVSLGPEETLQVVDDNPAQTYDDDTWVDTATTGVSARADMTIVPLIGLPATGSDTGTDHTTLSVHIAV